MKIEIDITPNDLANVICDLKFKNCDSKSILEQIVNITKKDIAINLEELEQMQFITDENSIADTEKRGNS